MTNKSREWNQYKKELAAYNQIQKALICKAEGDLEAAVNFLREAAHLNSNYAQTTLATMLDDELVPPRSTESVYWYRRAVRGGDSSAAWDLAMHYGRLNKFRWYSHWLRVAAGMGEPDVLNEIENRTWWNKFRAR